MKINKTENRKIIEKLTKPRVELSLQNINKIDKYLARLKEKRVKTQN